ncbi:MAG: ATP-binding protein [Eubacterium sp.]|nr:ATP-binding protein [Eubacterium sp.]
MERFAMEDMIKWKNDPKRKPLVLMGARQVGKTWLMKTFGERYYDKVAYVSFYNNSNMARVFDQDYHIDRIIAAINIEVGFPVTPENTLIIFDEIQNAPRAFESLKYFCEDAPQYHVMAAGSLLGVAIHNGVSYPVGKVDLLNLYPLNFREFLAANQEQGLVDALDSEDYSLIDAYADRFLNHLKNYYYVGGMPAAVVEYVENKDYQKVRSIQSDIITQYRGDFGKHIDASILVKTNMVWDSIPIQLSKENKKFFFRQIKQGGRSAEFETSIQWLTDCGLVHKVYKVNEPHIPLSAYKDIKIFKLFMVDIGLLGAMSDLSPKAILEDSQLFVEFKGALTEQYVFQQLISDTRYTPYYFGTKKATFEQDFIVQDETKIIPIEVKAGKNVSSASMKSFYEKYHPEVTVRFSALPYKDQGWMKNIPLYAVCNL